MSAAEIRYEKLVAKEAFNKIDVDGSGMLDIDELRNLTADLGKKLSDDDLRRAMAEMDDDESGEVEYAELCIKSDRFCIKNDGFCIKMMDFV